MNDLTDKWVFLDQVGTCVGQVKGSTEDGYYRVSFFGGGDYKGISPKKVISSHDTFQEAEAAALRAGKNGAN